jgi:hypothetical protein
MKKPQTNCCRWFIRNFARLASTKLSKEQRGQSLQPTMLVHEAYLRLVDVAEPQEWQGRGPSLPLWVNKFSNRSIGPDVKRVCPGETVAF